MTFMTASGSKGLLKDRGQYPRPLKSVAFKARFHFLLGYTMTPL